MRSEQTSLRVYQNASREHCDAQIDLAVLEGGKDARALGGRLVARIGGGGDRAGGVCVREFEQLDELGETGRGLDRLGEAEGVADAGRVEQVEEQQRLVLGRRRGVVLLRGSAGSRRTVHARRVMRAGRTSCCR